MKVPQTKPHILRNKHKHAPYQWRCVFGRYNGYADTLIKAYAACARSLHNSKYWENDVKRNPAILSFYQTAKDRKLV